MCFYPIAATTNTFGLLWAQYIKEYGLTQAYNNPEINYHPVILFIIKGFTLFADNPNYTNINWLKIPTAVFDWGIIFIALKLMQQHKVNQQWGLLLAFNPAFWYNTVIWGQFDSIWVFFVLLSFYFAEKKNFSWSTIAFVLALNTKLFALIFLPFLILTWTKNRYSTIKQNVLYLSIAAALQVLLIAPFLYATRYTLYAIVQRSTEYYNSVSRNAYNIWYYFFDNPVATNDGPYLIPTIIMFLLAYSAILFYIFIKPSPLRGRVWEGAALISLIFFLFLTRMHERYAHAALVFSFIAFSLTPSPLSKREGEQIKSLSPSGRGI
ncbi:MAG: glycosyltransferase 87 family protein [Sphingobacteriales bacterium JAD_PAG50586_3]|nr:MAG: glycosyltransferase 87 family protein [Sphingobacteriales bacterium JAD_PAG50586_3]